MTTNKQSQMNTATNLGPQNTKVNPLTGASIRPDQGNKVSIMEGRKSRKRDLLMFQSTTRNDKKHREPSLPNPTHTKSIDAESTCDPS